MVRKDNGKLTFHPVFVFFFFFACDLHIKISPKSKLQLLRSTKVDKRYPTLNLGLIINIRAINDKKAPEQAAFGQITQENQLQILNIPLLKVLPDNLPFYLLLYKMNVVH